MTEKDLYKIAEKILEKLMLAEKNRDYEKYMHDFDISSNESFTEQKFLNEIDEMDKEMGVYKERQYLCSLKDFKPGCTRFVWKVSFEKGETIVVVGLIKKDDKYKVNEHYYC